MKKIKIETLIIGAGPAGMAAAMELAKRGKNFLVVEKQAHVGGLAKTYRFTEKEGDTMVTFLTDNGPHRFFSKNPYLYEFIEGLLKERWIKVSRSTRQYIDGKFYDYPVKPLQALKNLGFLRAVRMGSDYISAKITYGFLKKPVRNLEDYIVANFGKSLGKFAMINYTEKIWGVSSKIIHPDWAGQRIKGLNLTAALLDPLAKFLKYKQQGKPKTLVDEFFYPEYGTGSLYETIKEKIEAMGKRVFLNSHPIKIRSTGGKITGALLQTPTEQIEIECANLIESVPITEFIKIMEPPPSEAVLEAGKKLKHRSQVYLFITLNKWSVTKDQWIYFPSKDILFGRISEMKNFSSMMSPPGKTSLFVEFFCDEGDSVWNMNADTLFQLTMKHLEAVGLCAAHEVRMYYHIKQKNVYPLYDLHYQTYLAVLKNYLDSFSNLFYIGRPGRFRYNNQDHSLEMGMLAAKSIIDGMRYDIENVGNEKEYYEAGTIPHQASTV